MSAEHFQSANAYIEHGNATDLFPVEGLQADIAQYRDAALQLETVPSDEVIVVKPTGLASSYFLTQHPLSAIMIESLPTDIQTAVAAASGLDVADHTVIQIGRARGEKNRSLNEF